MESAGVTLVKGDLTGIVRARRLSSATIANIKQNLFFAFIYNAIGVPIAAGILYPNFGILLSPMIAAAAMSLSRFRGRKCPQTEESKDIVQSKIITGAEIIIRGRAYPPSSRLKDMIMLCVMRNSPISPERMHVAVWPEI